MLGSTGINPHAIPTSANMINDTGTYSGNTMSGTYASACGNSKGTWSAVKA